MSKGKLIVLEGLDGSGKATQAKLLAEHLAAQGVSVQKITFPDYASDSSALVKMYLAGQFGQHPDDVNAYAASSFYAVDRYASYKTSWGSFYEFRLLGLPAPDRVIYLQVDPAVSQRLMTQRYHGDESKKDVHEKDTAYLARSRAAAEFCARHLGWDTVHCTSGDAMRSIEEIQQEVQQLARKTLG